MPTPKRIVPAAHPPWPSQPRPPATPARSPEPKTITQARAAVNVAANDFENARGSYAAAGDRLNEAQIALARAMAAPT